MHYRLKGQFAGIFLLLSFISTFVEGQNKLDKIDKAPIDTGVLSRWPTLSAPAISPNGRYVGYVINQQPVGSSTLVLQDTNCSWQRKYIGAEGFYFSEDEHFAFFQKGDSLCFVTLGTTANDRIVQIQNFQVPWKQSGVWLAYQEKGSDSNVVLLNLVKGTEWRLGKIMDYSFEPNGNALALVKKIGEGDSSRIELQWLDLRGKQSSKQIWLGKPGEQPGSFTFDEAGQQMAFTVMQAGEETEQALWYYRQGTLGAELRLKDGDSRLALGTKLDGNPVFTPNGQWLFFTLSYRTHLKQRIPDSGAIQVDVWSYKDKILQPQQLVEKENRPPTFKAAIATDGQIFQILETVGEHLITPAAYVVDDIVVTSRRDTSARVVPRGDFTYPWSYSILCLKDGKRKSLGKNFRHLNCFSFSPDGKWIVFFDQDRGHYFSYDLKTGDLRNITEKLPTQVSRDFRFNSAFKEPADRIAGWVQQENRVLIYDNYDLWDLDPSMARPPLNITHRYGVIHQIKFRLFAKAENFPQEASYSTGDTLLFMGFQTTTKYNGFFRQCLGSTKAPELLTMGPYNYYREESIIPNYQVFDNGEQPIKALRSDCWLVRRESASEAPNFLITSDLKKYRPMSQLNPQESCNWLTTVLITWRQLDGTLSQGILYKPENFDPAKKYPLIIHYYEQVSHRLYEFPQPELSIGPMNIPWFVSRGYLVFTPDIHYKMANSSGKGIGAWAYNSVISAVNYLSKMPFVDGKRIGLQGHSFGAYQTNYLITHSQLFTAAVEAAGESDAISGYLNLTPFGADQVENHELQSIAETGQLRFGTTPWARPDLYLGESPVLYADKVTTPLLIMHNKKDYAVPWRQGIELYMALRRLGRRVWLLQYDEGTHIVLGKNALDFTIRMTQFFDYYLKATKPPQWMTEGIPAEFKGVMTGYQLDSSGRVP